MKNVILFIIYLLAVFGVFLFSYDEIIYTFSDVVYNKTHLGIATGNVIILIVYCIWTYTTSDAIIRKLPWNKTLMLLFFLFLDVITVPISILLIVLINNKYAKGTVYTDDVLNIFALFLLYSVLNCLFYLSARYFIQKERK